MDTIDLCELREMVTECHRPSDEEPRMSNLIVQADAAGEVLHCNEGLSFWGGVDPDTGKVIDHANTVSPFQQFIDEV